MKIQELLEMFEKEEDFEHEPHDDGVDESTKRIMEIFEQIYLDLCSKHLYSNCIEHIDDGKLSEKDLPKLKNSFDDKLKELSHDKEMMDEFKKQLEKHLKYKTISNKLISTILNHTHHDKHYKEDNHGGIWQHLEHEDKLKIKDFLKNNENYLKLWKDNIKKYSFKDVADYLKNINKIQTSSE